MKINKARLYFICILLFVFQPALESRVGWFKYYDEVITLIFLMYYAIRLPYRRAKKLEIQLLTGIVLLTGIGLVGNVVSHSGQKPFAIAQDIFSNAKLMLFVVAIQCMRLPDGQKEEFKDLLAGFIRLMFAFMFITALLSQVVDIGMSDKARYGLASYKFIYVNPAGFNTYCYLFMIIHSMTLMKRGKLRPYSNAFTLMGIIAWMLSLRSRAIAFAVIYAVLYVYILYYRKRKAKFKFRWYHVVIVVATALLLGWSAIETYFIQNSRTARFQLMYHSLILAKQYFPIGTGFGTFGTEASRAYYSSIYYRYGLSQIYGLSPNYPTYVTDQFWFGILGQFGVLGSIVVAAQVYAIYRAIWRFARKTKPTQLAALTLFFTSLLASFTAGTMIQASILPSVLVLYLLRES